jgi:hypothetical protein
MLLCVGTNGLLSYGIKMKRIRENALVLIAPLTKSMKGDDGQGRKFELSLRLSFEDGKSRKLGSI